MTQINLTSEIIDIDNMLNSQHESRLVTAKCTKVSRDTAVFELVNGTKCIVPVTSFYPNKTWVVDESYIMLVVSSNPLQLTAIGTDLVELLAEGVIPEVRDGQVRIAAVARQPGVRTKISVVATKPELDAVGACLGRAASRAKSISAMLLGERIDIVAYNSDPIVHALNALAVGVTKTSVSPDETINVYVPQHKLLAALGGGNINAILAAKLVGRKIIVTGV